MLYHECAGCLPAPGSLPDPPTCPQVVQTSPARCTPNGCPGAAIRESCALHAGAGHGWGRMGQVGGSRQGLLPHHPRAVGGHLAPHVCPVIRHRSLPLPRMTGRSQLSGGLPVRYTVTLPIDATRSLRRATVLASCRVCGDALGAAEHASACTGIKQAVLEKHRCLNAFGSGRIYRLRSQ